MRRFGKHGYAPADLRLGVGQHGATEGRNVLADLAMQRELIRERTDIAVDGPANLQGGAKRNDVTR